METFIASATAEEIADATSWVNVGYQVDQSEYDIFFKALGEAIGTWSLLELNLKAVFHIAMGESDYRAVAGIFDRLEGFRAKLGVTDAAIRASTRVKPDLAIWTEIRDALDRQSKGRNALAHHTVFYNHSAPRDRRFFLSVTSGKEDAPSRCVSEIQELRANFEQTSDRLTLFHAEMLAEFHQRTKNPTY